MSKNLAYLPSVVGPGTGSESVAYYYVYGYDGTSVSTAKATTNYSTYGVLYNWPAASTVCPYGWHLPTDAEQYTLEDYYATGTCDAARTAYDCDPAGTSLKSGVFNAKLAGNRGTDGRFINLSSYTFFWSSTPSGSLAWRRALLASYSTVLRGTYSLACGFSVRCLKD